MCNSHQGHNSRGLPGTLRFSTFQRNSVAVDQQEQTNPTDQDNTAGGAVDQPLDGLQHRESQEKELMELREIVQTQRGLDAKCNALNLAKEAIEKDNGTLRQKNQELEITLSLYKAEHLAASQQNEALQQENEELHKRLSLGERCDAKRDTIEAMRLQKDTMREELEEFEKKSKTSLVEVFNALTAEKEGIIQKTTDLKQSIQDMCKDNPNEKAWWEMNNKVTASKNNSWRSPKSTTI